MCLAIPGRIINVDEGDALLRQGRVDFSGIVKNVSMACVPEAAVGDYVLVHAGIAISRVDEDEARRVFDFLKDIGDLEEVEGGAT